MAPGECCRPARTAFPFNAAQGDGTAHLLHEIYHNILRLRKRHLPSDAQTGDVMTAALTSKGATENDLELRNS